MAPAAAMTAGACVPRRIAPERTVRRARVGVFGVFGLCGLTVALWGAALPGINERLTLGEARTGIVLLATGLGAVICMPIAGRLCERWSSRRGVALVAPASALALIGPALAPSYPTLLAATFVFGAGTGALDVAMNAHAVEVEQRYGRPILSSFHGVWSLGGVLGGTVIAAGLYAGRNVGSVMVVGALATAALSLLPVVWLLPGRTPVEQDMAATGNGPVSLSRRAVLLLGLVAFASFVCEGAAMDWSALYANTVLGADLAGASIAFTTFAVAMTATRFIGDRIRGRFGSAWTVQKAAATAVAGFLLVVLAPSMPVGALLFGYAGWRLVGAGLAIVVPVVFAATGSGGASAGPALARVTTFGYVGMLAGPSVIGPFAEATSLRVALILPAALAVGIMVLGPRALREAAP